MNTKEAIEFCKGLKNNLMIGQMYIIISLLERGEKYEQMWKEFKEEYKNCLLNYHGHNRENMTEDYFVDLKMDKFERKYFLESIKKTITIEIKSTDEAKLKNWIGWFMDNNLLKCDKNNIDYHVEIKEGD